MHRGIPGAVLLLIATLGAPIGASAQPAIEGDLSRGDASYLEFDNGAALSAYEIAAVHAPDSFGVLIRLARTSYDFGLDRLADADPVDAESLFVRSVRYAERLVQLHPDHASSHLLLAATLGNLAQFRGPREKVKLGRRIELESRRSIAIDSTYSYPYIALGVFCREVAELNWMQRTLAHILYGGIPDATYDDALRLLRTAVRLDPEVPFAHFELAKTYRVAGHLDRAIHHLRRLIDLPPLTTQDRRNQAWAATLLDTWTREVIDERP